MLASLLLVVVAAALFRPVRPPFAARRILLLTAHPDDECLFFAPTLLALAHQPVYSLTLSTGNADGLGNLRRRELHGSLNVLGVSPDRRWAIDHPYVRATPRFFTSADAHHIGDCRITSRSTGMLTLSRKSCARMLSSTTLTPCVVL